MPTIESVTLEVQDVAGRNEAARMNVELKWTEGDYGHRFRLRGYLYEEEGQKDSFEVAPDGTPVRVSRGCSDDRMGMIQEMTVVGGAANSTWSITLHRSWNFPRTGEVKKEYYGIATIVPLEIIGQIRLSRTTESHVG